MMIFRALHKGFAFAEIMMALAMLGFLLTALLTLQSNVYNRVVKSTFKIDRFYPLKNMFIAMAKKPFEKGKTKEEVKVEKYNLTVLYEQNKIKEISSLYRFAGLYQKRCSGSWLFLDRERSQELVGYGYAFPEKKS